MAVEVVAFLSLGIMRLIVDTSVILIKFFAKATRLYNNTFIVKNLRLASLSKVGWSMDPLR